MLKFSCHDRLKDINFSIGYDCAIFTGGEERSEMLTNFNLVPNTLFDDGIHKYMVNYEDYVREFEKMFFDISLEELYKLMPGNPKWIDGARAGAIIPSDLNLINGVIRDL